MSSATVLIASMLQVALTAVKECIGAVSYVEFVLHPAPMFETFVGVADRVLEQIQPAGGAQLSEPIQQVGCTQFSQWTSRPHMHIIHDELLVLSCSCDEAFGNVLSTQQCLVTV